MQLTQRDYDERKARTVAGSGDDDDLRLVKLYEREGFEPSKPETDEATPGGVDDSTDYDGWTNAQLADEVKRRREAGREIHLDGRKQADVIAALTRDDEAGDSE